MYQIDENFLSGMCKTASLYSKIMTAGPAIAKRGLGLGAKAGKKTGDMASSVFMKRVRDDTGKVVGKRLGGKRVVAAGLGSHAVLSGGKAAKAQQDRYGQSIGPSPQGYSDQSSQFRFGR